MLSACERVYARGEKVCVRECVYKRLTERERLSMKI